MTLDTVGDKDTGVTRAQHEPSGKDTATARAQQPSHTAVEARTGDELDEHVASAGVVLRESGRVDTVFARVPGMDEFEATPDVLREWLQTHGFLRTERQMSEFERQLTKILLKHQKIVHRGGDGYYHADDYGKHWDQQSEQRQEQINELQSQDWARMLRAWEQFHQQVNDLRTVADGNADEIVYQIGHTITALNMIVHEDWAPFCAEEFNAWAPLIPADLPLDRLHTAAHTIVEAGEHLYNQWYQAIEAGNYHSHTLSQPQSEFITHCAQARAALHH